MYTSKFLSKKLIDKFIEEYTINNISIKNIAKKYNSSEQSVSKYLKLANICINSKSKYSKEDCQKWIDLYLSGESLTNIAKKYKVDRNTISYYLKLNNIEVINRQNMLRFDETVFDSIDTEEKAYWLGFIYADGCVYCDSKGKYRFELGLKWNDYNHLLKFSNFLKLDRSHIKKKEIHLNNKIFYSCRICLSAQYFCNVLISLGCSQRKSLTLKFPEETIFKSKDLIRHFIRGYFDGDGCFSYRKVTHKDVFKPFISMLGTSEFLQKLSTYITPYTTITSDKRRSEHTNILNIRTNGNTEFCKFIYDNSTVYLDRKYNRYLFFKNNCRSSKELEELLESEIGESWDVNTEIN